MERALRRGTIIWRRGHYENSTKKRALGRGHYGEGTKEEGTMERALWRGH